MTVNRTILLDDSGTPTYLVTMENGDPTPTWLDVKYPNETTSGDYELSGAYPVFEEVLLELRITATDSAGLTAFARIYIQTKSKLALFSFCSRLSCEL